MKLCKKCLEEKSLKEFYKNGKEYACKTCCKLQAYLRLYPNQDAPRGKKSSEERKGTQARYRDKNREKIRAGQRRYVKENLPKVLARTKKYQAGKINATPPWLTNKHDLQMQDIYITAAKLTKVKGAQEVDHIIPLCGVNVSGLHVPWNLQIISRTENRRKHNKC